MKACLTSAAQWQLLIRKFEIGDIKKVEHLEEHSRNLGQIEKQCCSEHTI